VIQGRIVRESPILNRAVRLCFHKFYIMLKWC